MKTFIDQITLTRDDLLKRVRQVSAYFTQGGGQKATGEAPKLAWTSEEQKERAKKFRELAAKLADDERAA